MIAYNKQKYFLYKKLINMKIQKYLAHQDLCSRRQAETRISQGFVFVNWKKAHIWQVIYENEDKITLSDEVKNIDYVYYAYYKPKWIFTVNATKWEKEIKDIVNLPKSVLPIGRLDKDTSGLIIMTNDRTLQKQLLDPMKKVEKEYIVSTKRDITDEQLEKLENWVMIDGYLVKNTITKRIGNNHFSLTITEWKNRQVRKMVRAIQHIVIKLKRVRVGNITLWNLEEWEFEKISKKDIFGG